jgi:DNA gyrase subunit A
MRRVPDLRDGLTPVSRRVLEALPASSSARWARASEILRRVIGTPPPPLEQQLLVASPGAGDSHLSAYLELVEMVQPFRTRYPLAEGQGNFGSLDGEPPSGPAFTKARILPFGEAVILGIAPNLLVNGAGNRLGSTQAVALPHHLGEVLDAAQSLLLNPELSDEALVDSVVGPDFPTGGVISRSAETRAVDCKGLGSLTVRARMHSEQMGLTNLLVVSELPFGASKSSVVQEVSGHLGKGDLEGVTDLLDESDGKRVRLVLVLSRDAVLASVRDRLLKRTSLQTVLHVSMKAQVGGQNVQVTLPLLVRSYVRSCLARAKSELGGSVPEALAERVLRDFEEIRTAYQDQRRTLVE